MFHGSVYPFKPGDIIRGHASKGGASATHDVTLAREFAENRNRVVLPHQKEAGYAPRVFRVEPVSTAVLNRLGKHQGRELNDPEGFRVIGEHTE
jgi:hypothetical protein